VTAVHSNRFETLCAAEAATRFGLNAPTSFDRVSMRRSLGSRCTSGSSRGFTIVETLVVIGVIVLLLAILLPALFVARANAIWATSQSSMRQIHTLMHTYSTENREFIVPSQFDYSAANFPGKVRTESPPGTSFPVGEPNQGTWSDILWTLGEFGPIFVGDASGGADYRFDSPDQAFYNYDPDFKGPFRSAALNTLNTPGNSGDAVMLPFGDGARDIGLPGYFAANDFFNARPDAPGGGRWFTTGQIRVPSASVYLADSYRGEVIPLTANAWNSTPSTDGTYTPCHIDFRYPGETALLLMLDGSVLTQARWGTVDQLLDDRQIRVGGLDSAAGTPPN